MKTFYRVATLATLSVCTLAAKAQAQLLGGDAASKLTEYSDEVGAASGFGQTSIGTIIATIIQAGLGLLAAIFLALMLFAGFRWMTAAGNDAQVKKAQDTIKTAIIGLVIVLAAYAITYFIFKYLPFSGGKVTPSGGGGLVGSGS